MDRGKSSEDLIREARQWSETPGQAPSAEPVAAAPRASTPTMAARDPFPSPAPAPPPFEPIPAPPQPERSGGSGLRFAVLVAVVGVALAGFFAFRAAGSGSQVEIFAVDPGTCFLEPTGGTITHVDVVECTESHDLEAFAVVTLPYSDDAAIPARDDLFDTAYTQCLPFFTPYTGEPYETSRWYLDAFVPDHRGWKLGDREALCVLFLATSDGTLLPATESAQA